MRTILLSAFAAVATLTASALEINVGAARIQADGISATASAGTFKEKYHLDRLSGMERVITDKNIMARQARAGIDESELVTNPEGAKTRYAMAADIFLSHMGAAHVGGFGAEVITSADDSKFYSRAFTLNFFQQGYSEGDIAGDSVVFHSGQYIYNTEDGDKAYMYAAYMAEDEEWPEFCDTFVLTKDEQGRYVSAPGYYFMVMTEEEAEYGINESSYIICFGTNYVFTPLPTDLTEAKLPEGADVFECQLFANSLYDYGEPVMKSVTVGVSGDNIYIGGLTDYLPGSYMMGTKTSDNTFTFSTHQYISYYDEGEYPYIYEFAMVNPLYFDGESLAFKEADSVTMTFNEDRTLLTLEEEAGVFVCSYGDISSWNEVYWNMLIGDFNQPLTPQEASDVECYDGYGAPYITFEWDNISVEGTPMIAENLWCEVIINGEPYKFLPKYYNGLAETSEKVYFNTAGIEGFYLGNFTTIYLYEFEDNFYIINSVGVKIGYQCGDEIRYSDIVYAKGFEPFEDKAYIPSTPGNVIYYKDYYDTIEFKFDGKDVEGNIIPKRLLGVEILLDGIPLIFKDSDYYFNGNGDGPDVTIIGLAEHSLNYSIALVTDLDGKYIISLFGHDEIPEFKSLAVRAVCTGAGTLTYGESCEIVLERAATPANPWDVTYNEETRTLDFGALPIDTTGNGLAPWNYGYEVYVNDALYEFNGEMYDIENNITLIPYEGFEYNYYFYLHTNTVYDETDWSVIGQNVVMSVSMLDENLDIKKIGVRAVYTDGEGNTTYSEIVNSDGTIGTVGIDTVCKDNEEVKWYNLQGVEVANPEAGSVYLRQQGGKTTKVLVK